ncbi:MAG: Crp/Fnr family transcriptional regulator [Eubacteriales bacterium]|nr:Crp/Fnr family transcriptional regulator [Eubacteriales bacterium]
MYNSVFLICCFDYSIINSTIRLNFQRKRIFMKDFLHVIRSSQLFSGISENELAIMLSCLDTKKESFPKDAFLLRVGDTAESIGLVLSGSVLIIQEDIWGNRNILLKTGPRQSFAAAYACAPGSVLNVSVVAETPVTVMFLNVKRILNVCSSVCAHHSRIIRNLLGELAEKNLRFSEKLIHVGQRTTRAKLMSYFSAEAQRLGKYEFDIPFSRQQLADYLGVERSGLSLELGKMKKDGLLDFYKSHFILKV